MTKDRKDTQIYLLDIKYKHSMNHFESFYGDCFTFAHIEQESYIDLKQMVAEMISGKIKFRKHDRNNTTLTLKVEMLDEELEKLRYLIKEGKMKFLHEYEISNIKTYKNI